MTIPNTEDATPKRFNSIPGARTDCGGMQSVRPAAPAILAIVPHLAMLANAAAPAIRALVPLPAMLANAAAPDK